VSSRIVNLDLRESYVHGKRLLHTQLSPPPPELCDVRDDATHFHVFGLHVSDPHTAGCASKEVFISQNDINQLLFAMEK
jgi:hypothetical protein